MAKKKKTVRRRRAKKSSLTLPTTKSIIATKLLDYILMFYGPPGVGKTTFVNSLAEKVFFISTEHGTRFLSAMREEVHSWKDVKAVADALESMTTSEQYDIICIDHIDDFLLMAEDYVCETLEVEALSDAGYGTGWKAYKNTVRSMFRRLLGTGCALVFICHERIRTIRTRAIEIERTMPSLSKSSWDMLIPMTDLIGYCGFRREGPRNNRKEVRTIETEPREDLYAKDRTSRQKPSKGYGYLDGKEFVVTFSKGARHGERKTRTKVGRRARH